MPKHTEEKVVYIVNFSMTKHDGWDGRSFSCFCPDSEKFKPEYFIKTAKAQMVKGIPLTGVYSLEDFSKIYRKLNPFNTSIYII